MTGNHAETEKETLMTKLLAALAALSILATAIPANAGTTCTTSCSGQGQFRTCTTHCN